jgi:4-hydroxy-tetrahydrodipicolinate synthase
MPGTGTTSIPDTVLLTRRARELGCRGALLLPPFFYKNPSTDGLFAWFSEVIQRLGGGIALYLYHFPQHSAVPFGLDLVARLLRAWPGAIRGIKDSSGDFANTRAYVEHFARDGFEVYCGDDAALLDLLRVGGAGCITACANVASPLSARVVAGWNGADGPAAQAVLAAVRSAVTATPLIPSVKALLARHHGDPSWRTPRPPHLPLAEEAAARLFTAFDATGVTLDRPTAAAA